VKFSLNRANEAAAKVLANFKEGLPTRRWIYSLEILELFIDFSRAGISIYAALPFILLLRLCFWGNLTIEAQAYIVHMEILVHALA